MAGINVSKNNGDQTDSALGLASLIPGGVGAIAKGLSIAKGVQNGNVDALGALQGADAISRKMDSMQGDHQAIFHEAMQHLVDMPPEYRQAFGPTIVAGYLQTNPGNPTGSA